MKNIKNLSLLAAFTILGLSSCFDDDYRFGCLDADGPISTATLDLADIEGIDLEMSARVILTEGPQQEVVVEGKSDIIDLIDLDVHNGIWEIRTEDCVRNVDDLTFFVTLPTLKHIKVSASGEVESDNLFIQDDVSIHISGSGEVDMALDADDVDVRISGSGKVKLEGVADELDVSISGSGDVRAFHMPVRVCDANISGSGDAEVLVDDLLEVSISGSGDVYFKGNPLLDISISGSGDVIDAN